MNEENSELYVTNEYNNIDNLIDYLLKEKLPISKITFFNLLKLGSDPFMLYMFYLKCSLIQNTNSVYAINSFCKKGLVWGDRRLKKARDLLKTNNFIENIVRKDDNGTIIGHYIKLNYLLNPEISKILNKITTGAEIHTVDASTSGSQATNAYNEDINAYNEEEDEITNVISPTKLENIEEIFNYYLKIAHKIKNYLKVNNIKSNKLTIHQSINSKCAISLPDNKDDAISIPIIDIISEYLDFYSVDEFKTAIDNYYTVFISNLTENKYWYKVIWKDIGSFIYSGVHRNTGFKSFLNLDNLKKFSSEIDQLRSEFKPITKEYDSRNIYNEEEGTYYGFESNRLRNSSLINEYESDIKRGYNNNEFSYGYFCYLEELIASIFFNRKAGYDLELLKALMSIWKEKKPEFKKIVLGLR